MKNNDLMRNLKDRILLAESLEFNLEREEREVENHDLRSKLNLCKRTARLLRERVADSLTLVEQLTLEEQRNKIMYYVSSDKHQPKDACDMKEAETYMEGFLEDGAKEVTIERNSEYRAEKNDD